MRTIFFSARKLVKTAQLCTLIARIFCAHSFTRTMKCQETDLQYNREHMETEHQSPRSAKTAWKSQLLFAIPLGLLLFATTACIFLIGFEVNQKGKIFPGVSMSGIDLSDLTRQEAAAQVTQKIDQIVDYNELVKSSKI